MRRLKSLGSLSAALILVGLAATGTASAALPQVLPEKPAGTTGKNGVQVLL
jgi:hypothetical protein